MRGWDGVERSQSGSKTKNELPCKSTHLPMVCIARLLLPTPPPPPPPPKTCKTPKIADKSKSSKMRKAESGLLADLSTAQLMPGLTATTA